MRGLRTGLFLCMSGNNFFHRFAKIRRIINVGCVSGICYPVKSLLRGFYFIFLGEIFDFSIVFFPQK